MGSLFLDVTAIYAILLGLDGLRKLIAHPFFFFFNYFLLLTVLQILKNSTSYPRKETQFRKSKKVKHLRTVIFKIEQIFNYKLTGSIPENLKESEEEEITFLKLYIRCERYFLSL